MLNATDLFLYCLERGQPLSALVTILELPKNDSALLDNVEFSIIERYITIHKLKLTESVKFYNAEKNT
jgi:hypothetical protein